MSWSIHRHSFIAPPYFIGVQSESSLTLSQDFYSSNTHPITTLMDVDLLQQILTGLQQNNADLNNIVNSQNHQIMQQLAAIQNLQAVPAGALPQL